MRTDRKIIWIRPGVVGEEDRTGDAAIPEVPETQRAPQLDGTLENIQRRHRIHEIAGDEQVPGEVGVDTVGIEPSVSRQRRRVFPDEVQVLVELHQAPARSARRRPHVRDEKPSVGQRQKVVGDTRVGCPRRVEELWVAGVRDVEEEDVVLALEHTQGTTAAEDLLAAAVVIATGCEQTRDVASPSTTPPTEVSLDLGKASGHGAHAKEATTLYVWASDQDGVSPDFLAVIDFDRESRNYGQVIRTVPIPPPATPATSRITATRPPRMDVKLIPGDKRGRAVTVNMFTGFFYSVDPTDGSYEQAFDTETMITPHVATPVRGGMPGLIAMPRSGRRLITATFMAGQVVMLDITNPKRFKQVSVVSFGKDTGPHSVHLTHDDKRLVVTNYFLNQAGFGKVQLEGDHKVHVLDVKENSLTVDPAFQVIDFNTAFPTGPARPHGIGMK